MNNRATTTAEENVGMGTLQHGGDRDQDNQRAAELSANERADERTAEWADAEADEREELRRADMDETARDRWSSGEQRYDRRGWVVADSDADSDVDC